MTFWSPCVCGVCMYVCACRHMYIHMCEGHWPPWVLFHRGYLPCSLRRGFSLTCCSARPMSPGISCFYLPGVGIRSIWQHALLLNVGSGELNSDPHVCMANIFWQPYLQPNTPLNSLLFIFLSITNSHCESNSSPFQNWLLVRKDGWLNRHHQVQMNWSPSTNWVDDKNEDIPV